MYLSMFFMCSAIVVVAAIPIIIMLLLISRPVVTEFVVCQLFSLTVCHDQHVILGAVGCPVAHATD